MSNTESGTKVVEISPLEVYIGDLNGILREG